MKVAFPRLSAALAALLAGGTCFAQVPLPVVELAKPIVAEPIPAESLPTEPTPAKDSPAAEKAPAEATVTDDDSADQVNPAEQINVAAKPLQEGAGDDITPQDAAENEAAADGPKIEVVQERYPNGVIRVEREVTQDADGNYIPHGLWRQFDQTGRLIAEGRFVESRKEGIWRRLYRGDDAPLLITVPYNTFTPPFVSQATFAKGQLHGKWTVTDAQQRKIHEIEFVEGERHGAATWFYPSGQTMLEAQYDHGRANGELKQHSSDGQLIAKETYESGRKLAPKIEYHDAAQLLKKTEATFLHAALVIKTADNWDKLTLAVFEARGQDEKHGPFLAWHENGQIARQGEFRYDQPVGKFQYWYANGQKQMDGSYVDGRPDGDWIWWHENGLKSIAGGYRDGAPAGLWQWWKATGKLAYKNELGNTGPLVGPTPEAESEDREAKVRLAEEPVELR